MREVDGKRGWVTLEHSLGVPLGLSGLYQSGPGLRKMPTEDSGELTELVSSTVHTLCLCLIEHWLHLGKVFCLKPRFQTVKVYKQKPMLWSLPLIGFRISLKQTFLSYFLLSPKVCSVTSRRPNFFINIFFFFNFSGPRALTDHGRLVEEEKIIFLLPFWVFSPDLCNKRLTSMRKQTSFAACIPHVFMGDTQEKISISLRWLRI